MSALVVVAALRAAYAVDGPPNPLRNGDGSCAVFPGSHLDMDVSNLPVHNSSAGIISVINNGDPERGMHADFAGGVGSGASAIFYGIPFAVVDSNPSLGQSFPPGPMDFYMYPMESDKLAGVTPGQYPFPANASVELSYPGCTTAACIQADRHVLAIDNYTCILYEAWKCEPPANATTDPWRCANGAAFNLSNPLLPQRPLGWTSADAAGLPIYAGLVKLDEIKAGVINHAIRFTAPYIRAAYAYPAGHLVTGQGWQGNRPWMGLRARLSAGFNCSALQTTAGRVVCLAMQKYGILLADVGSSWYLTGEANPEWESYMNATERNQMYADISSIKGKYMEILVPPGDCQCTNSDCKDSQGNPLCPAPFLPSEWVPPPPSNDTSNPPPANNTDPQAGTGREADGSCSVLQGSHFTTDVSAMPKHPRSNAIVRYISEGDEALGMHADFGGHLGSGPTAVYYGIPFAVVDSDPAKGQSFPPGPTDFYMYPTESDQKAGVPYGSGRYPFPANATIELAYPGCSMTDCDTDRHVLVVDNYTCTLYEGWKCDWPSGVNAPWSCANGAAFNLSNPLLPQRPLGWTSADAAGLPIYPGLVKVSEIKAGVINHAIRFTCRRIRDSYQYPGGHLVTGQGGTGPNRAWMGLRARLRAGFDCGALQNNESVIICTAMKKYGVILADVGRPWFLTGEASPEWEAVFGNRLQSFFNDMSSIKGIDMEVVTPPDFCLCNISTCLTEVGTLQCLPPEVPGTQHPDPPNGTHIVIQTGRKARLLNGTSIVYNWTQDVGISTQYNDSWNNYQGVTYYWPETQTIPVTDSSTYDKTMWRVPMRFRRLEQFIPAGATIQSALLNLTFINWDPYNTYTLTVCPLTQHWVPTKPASSYQGVGWQWTGLYSGTQHITWKQPGAAGDCGPLSWSAIVAPGHERTGYMAVSIPIPEPTIQAWIANNGSQNFGLLLRANGGNINLRMSQFYDPIVPISVRPALDIFFDAGPAWGGYPPDAPAPSPSPPPADLGNTDPRPPAARNPDGSCQVLQGSHLTMDVSGLPVHEYSPTILSNIALDVGMHPDFGGYEDSGQGLIYYGIPFDKVDSDPAKGQSFPPGPTFFNMYPTESDQKAGIPYGSGRYPFPWSASVEGATYGCGSADCNTDRHVLVVDNYTCVLYEGWKCDWPADANSPWTCANGAAFNLSNPLLPQRPLGWTSADAAGLPIYAGLVRVEDIRSGAINHTIRFTAKHVQPVYEFPAAHLITGHGSGGDMPWMGLRARLRPTFNCNTLNTTAARIVCTALKKYGVILSDIGSNWFLTGEASPEWEDVIPDLSAFSDDLRMIRGYDMQVVKPPDFCLCKNAECLDYVGTQTCPTPQVPGTVNPPPPNGTHLVIQTGKTLPQLDGGVTASYNGTVDAGMTSQYIASWNLNQGITYYWPTASDRTVQDVSSDGTQYRVLLRFDNLHLYIPSSAIIQAARLNITFLNWESHTNVLEICVITKPWVGTQPAQQYTGLGWNITGAKDGLGKDVVWTQPGGWADCDPANTWNVSVPVGHMQSGMMQVPITLPAAVLLGWVANSGASNFGLLLRCKSGAIHVRPSHHATYPSVRPALDVYYQTLPTCAPGTGGASCSACAVGQYSYGGNATAPKPPCSSCPAGVSTAGIGAASADACSVTICLAGQGGGGCATCPAGRYSGGGNATNPTPACALCPTGTTTVAPGASSSAQCNVTVCAPGKGGPSCLACLQGQYSAGGNATLPQPGCVNCTGGNTTAAAGATSPSACNVKMCPPGSGGYYCYSCNVAYYSPGGNTTAPAPDCQKCPNNTTTASSGSKSAAACNMTICPAGTGGGSCAPCAIGTYGVGGSVYVPYLGCYPCPTGYTTLTNGSKSAAACNVTICTAGKCGGPCSPCTIGTYSTGGTATAPKLAGTQCPSGYTTAAAGATSKSLCNVAVCKAGTGGNPCTTCKAGQYSPGGTPTTPKPPCQTCPTGTTSAAGATTCAKKKATG